MFGKRPLSLPEATAKRAVLRRTQEPTCWVKEPNPIKEKWSVPTNATYSCVCWDLDHVFEAKGTQLEVRSLTSYLSQKTTYSEGPIHAMAVSKVGDLVYLTADSLEGNVHWCKWDHETETFTIGRSWKTESPQTIAVTSDGSFVATRSSRELKIWKIASGALVHELTEQAPGGVAFSADGTLVMTDSIHCIQLRDTTTGEVKRTLTGIKGHITSMCISPDANWVAVGTRNGTLYICDIRKGDIFQECGKRHLQAILGVVIAPTMDLIMTAGDKRILFWRLTTGSFVDSASAQETEVGMLDFNPAGHELASMGKGERFRMWELNYNWGEKR